MDELKNQCELDNSRLEELLEDFFNLPIEGKNEFVEILKNSRLMMPVEVDISAFDLENSKLGEVQHTEEPVGFDIKYLENEKGKSVPLFTGEEAMKASGIMCSTYVIYMSDLAEMLKENDRYSFVTINPFSPHAMDIEIESFLAMFEEESVEDEFLKLLEIIKMHSIELEENATFFIRSDENFMIENADEGVFRTPAPFVVSSNPKYREDLKYTNILLMPKSKRILPLGEVENDLDIVIAPETEFRLEDTMDRTQNLWMCTKQPFFE